MSSRVVESLACNLIREELSYVGPTDVTQLEMNVGEPAASN